MTRKKITVVDALGKEHKNLVGNDSEAVRIFERKRDFN